MEIVNSCKLKLLLDRIKFYEIGIFDIIMNYIDFILLFYSSHKIKIDIETDLFRMCFFNIKDNVQINLILKNIENKKKLNIDERKYYIYNFVHHKILDDYLDKKKYLVYKNNFFDSKLRDTKIKNYFILLIESFINISYQYKFNNIVKIINNFTLK